MTEDPDIDIRVLDIVFQFNCKSTIGRTSLKLWALHQEGGYMMCDNDLVLGSTILNRLLDELYTTTMLTIEVGEGEWFAIEQNSAEVADDLLGVIGFTKRYL